MFSVNGPSLYLPHQQHEEEGHSNNGGNNADRKHRPLRQELGYSRGGEHHYHAKHGGSRHKRALILPDQKPSQWGATSPTKPTVPIKPTAAVISRELAKKPPFSAVLPECQDFGTLLSSTEGCQLQLIPAKKSIPSAVAISPTPALVQLARDRFPNVQLEMICAISALALYCRYCCRAEKKKFITIPTRTRCMADIRFSLPSTKIGHRDEKGKRKSSQRRTNPLKAADADARHNGDGSAEAGAGGNTQSIGAGQWIIGNSLDLQTRNGQAAAHTHTGQCHRKANAPNNQAIGSLCLWTSEQQSETLKKRQTG